MTPSPTTSSADATARRTIRFEAGGPAPEEVVVGLIADPPRVLGGSVVERVDQAGTAAVIHVGSGRLTVQADRSEATIELKADGYHAVHRSEINSMLEALTTRVCDPERESTRARLASRVGDPIELDKRANALFATRPNVLSEEAAVRLAIAAIDLTTLTGDDTNGRVRALCARARRPDPTDPTVGPTAAVCVYPELVALAVELTQGSPVAVASVAGAFPSGLSSLDVRLRDIDDAVHAGAHEVDIVLNRAAFLAGDHAVVARELQAMREHIGDRQMKVILETSELQSPMAIYAAAELAINNGTDWIKTSTGKTALGATPIAALTMAQAIAQTAAPNGRPVGLKISGGVRTAADALGYLAIVEAALGPAWLDPSRVRFGASGLLDVLVADLADFADVAGLQRGPKMPGGS